MYSLRHGNVNGEWVHKSHLQDAKCIPVPVTTTEKPRPLREGALGGRIVDYFEKEHQRVAVEAEPLSQDYTENTGNYRITFDDGHVEDWKFYFEGRLSLGITWAEGYDQII
jgi:hypothetical protein